VLSMHGADGSSGNGKGRASLAYMSQHAGASLPGLPSTAALPAYLTPQADGSHATPAFSLQSPRMAPVGTPRNGPTGAGRASPAMGGLPGPHSLHQQLQQAGASPLHPPIFSPSHAADTPVSMARHDSTSSMLSLNSSSASSERLHTGYHSSPHLGAQSAAASAHIAPLPAAAPALPDVPSSINLPALFSSYIDNLTLARLVAAAAPPSSMSATAASELNFAGLDAPGVDGDFEALDTALRPISRFIRSNAPPITQRGTDLWRTWRRVKELLQIKSSGGAAVAPAPHTRPLFGGLAEDEDDEDADADRSKQARREEAEIQRGLQLLRQNESNILHSQLAAFTLPPVRLTVEEEADRREEERAWSAGMHDLYERRKQKQAAAAVPGSTVPPRLLDEPAVQEKLREAVRSRRRAPGGDGHLLNESASSSASTASASSASDDSASPSSPSSSSGEAALPTSLADLLSPQHALSVTAKYEGLALHDWEAHVNWAKHDMPCSDPAAFGSLAAAAADVHAPRKFEAPPSVKAEQSAAASAKLGAAEKPGVAASFTYLPEAAKVVQSLWTEIPWPQRPATPPPQPAPAPAPVAPAAPTPAPFSNPALPFYPPGSGVPDSVFSLSSIAQQQAAAAFMNLSFGMPTTPAALHSTLSTLHAMGTDVAATALQQAHVALMQHLQQQHQQQQQLDQQQAAAAAAAMPAPAAAPAAPKPRGPIKFQVPEVPKQVGTVLAQPARVAQVFCEPEPASAQSVQEEMRLTAARREKRLGTDKAKADPLLAKLRQPGPLAVESIPAAPNAWVPAATATAGLPLEPVHGAERRGKSFPLLALPSVPIPSMFESWGSLSQPRPPQLADAPPPPPVSAPLSKLPNTSFASMDWLQHVVWDDVVSANDPPTALNAARRRLPVSDFTRLIWDVNDPHMLFESAEQIENSARKERERAAKQDAAAAAQSKELSADDKLGALSSRFNISCDAEYDVDASFSHTRIERVRLRHATFAADIDEKGYEWYRVRDEPVMAQLYPRNWHSKLHFADDEGALVTHRPKLPKRMLTALQEMGAIKLRVVDTPLHHRWIEHVRQRRLLKGAPEALQQLSMLDGGLVCLEYLEQHPLLLSKTGMASRLITYYRPVNEFDTKQIEPPEGDVAVLAKDEPSPFLGDIKPGQQVLAISNNLFIAPMARHAPPSKLSGTLGTAQRDMYCTFLLVKSGKRWHLRRLPTPFIVGQLEPKKVVPQPDREYSFELMRRLVQFTLLKLFYYKTHVSMEEAVALFERDQERNVRYAMREIAQTTRTFDEHQHELYRLAPTKDLPSIEKIRELFTPEEMCLLDSMRTAHYLLQAQGIRAFTHPKLVKEVLDHIQLTHLKRVALYIEKQLQLTPWYLTKGFNKSVVENKGQLQLEGRGNPMAAGAGYSYINERRKKEEDPNEVKEVKKKTGTDADLRSLTMEQLENALLGFGMTQAEVKKLPRWERARRVASFSTEAAREGTHATMNRFARPDRATLQTQQAEFRREVNKIFDKQLATIGFQQRPDYTHEVNDDPAASDASKAGAVPAAVSKAPKGSALALQREAAEEQRQYLEFLSAQQASTSTVDEQKKSSSSTDASGRPRQMRKRKRVKHTILNIQPDGTRVTIVKYIVDKKLIHYHELDRQDGGCRLEQALGLVSQEKKMGILASGGATVSALTDLSHIYESPGETTTQGGEELTRQKAVVGKGRGGRRGGGGLGRILERGEREPSGRGRRRDYGEGDGAGGRREHWRAKKRREEGRDGETDSDEHHGDDTEDDYEEDEHGGDQQPARPRSLGLPDADEKDADGNWTIRCGACSQLGHSQASLVCPCQEQEPEFDEATFMAEALKGNRSAERGAEAEEADDPSAKGLIAATTGGALKLNVKGISAVKQTGLKQRAPWGSKSGRRPLANNDEDDEMAFIMGGRKGTAKRARADEVYNANKRARPIAGVRRRGDAKVSMASVFSAVVDYASTPPLASWFREPVNAAQVADYYAIVKSPMDLRTLKQRAANEHYTSRAEFLSDARLIFTNCVLYNGPPEKVAISRDAQEVVTLIEQQLKRPVHASKLIEAELQYEHQVLHERLGECVHHLRGMPSAQSTFGYPPDDSVAPGYSAAIRRPMALSILNERIKNMSYHAPNEFVFDLELIANNAATYNGATHEIARQAQALVQRGKLFLKKYFSEEALQPKEHLLPQPVVRQSTGAAAATPAFGGARSTPRLSTPAQRTPRRTPDRNKRTPGMLASPGALHLGSGAGTAKRPATAASPGALHLQASPARLDFAATPAAASAAAASSVAPAAAAAPPSPRPLELSMDEPADGALLMGAPLNADPAAAAVGAATGAGAFGIDDTSFLPTDDELNQAQLAAAADPFLQAQPLDMLPLDAMPEGMDLTELPPE